jgi:coproporphyrinogen III oxidase
MRQEAATFFRGLQRSICDGLEQADGKGRFQADEWTRPDASGRDSSGTASSGTGGGGISRVLRRGDVFEQVGVNFSEVHGTLPSELCRTLIGSGKEEEFFACGVSLVAHPESPLVPTTHANYRYLEVGGKHWFGGGGDLTPYYLFAEDAEHFHRTLKAACDRHDPSYYQRFKKECDQYFFLPHRGEARGVGGIFFDYLGRDGEADLPGIFHFVQDVGQNFLESYLPILERRKHLPWSDEEKHFQLIRRGRYVEFNLVYDRGTLFGLKTGGRTESILMSLPPVVRWEYNFEPPAGSREAELIAVLRSPQEWA